MVSHLAKMCTRGSQAQPLFLYQKVDEIYAKLKESKVFSTLDMRSGYHHVEMTREAHPKTAFTYPANLGKWEFLRCPFGLAQAPAYFQRLINEVLAPFDFAFGYLDDILIYSPNVATHLKHLEHLWEASQGCS